MKRLRLYVSFFLSLAVATLPASAQVTVHYVNVGQAAAALLEFDSGLVMIDSGGEDTTEKTNGQVYRQHLIDYINGIFARHPSWNKTIEGLIVSHPHLDHTMLIMDVMNNFTVHTLVDNGAECGSGFAQLKKARAFATSHHLTYLAVRDTSIHASGFPIHLLDNSSPDAPQILLLSGGRGCLNANNDSIAVRIKTKEGTILFAGDSEDEDVNSKPCQPTLLKCVPEMSMLASKYGSSALLKADVYLEAHHGSKNGFTKELLAAVSPVVSVISAGDPLRTKPGAFHAWQFGHPNEGAVDEMIKDTSGMRTPVTAIVFAGGNTATSKTPSPPLSKTISKAVYCTCWDGDVEVSFAAGSHTPTVTPHAFRPTVPVADRPKKK